MANVKILKSTSMSTLSIMVKHYLLFLNQKNFIFLYCFLGECRPMPECEENELEDFPRRMREWLYNVMEELSERSELPAYFQKLQKESEVHNI